MPDNAIVIVFFILAWEKICQSVGWLISSWRAIIQTQNCIPASFKSMAADNIGWLPVNPCTKGQTLRLC